MAHVLNSTYLVYSCRIRDLGHWDDAIAVGPAHNCQMAGCLQQVYQVRQVAQSSPDQVGRRSMVACLQGPLTSLAEVVLRLCGNTVARPMADKVGERDHHNGRHRLIHCSRLEGHLDYHSYHFEHLAEDHHLHDSMAHRAHCSPRGRTEGYWVSLARLHYCKAYGIRLELDRVV